MGDAVTALGTAAAKLCGAVTDHVTAGEILPQRVLKVLVGERNSFFLRLADLLKKMPA